MARAKKTKAAPAPATPVHWRKAYDLTTVEGSKAHLAEYQRRQEIADDFHRATFEQIADYMDEIDRAIISVLTDLAGYNSELDGTIVEMAGIARASYVTRLAAKAHIPKAEVTP